MKKLSARCALSAAFLLAFGSLSAWAQLYTGSVTGAVKDPSGSSIPNAATGFTFKAATDASGIYTIRNVSPAVTRRK